jgi:hypothetical protein
MTPERRNAIRQEIHREWSIMSKLKGKAAKDYEARVSLTMEELWWLLNQADYREGITRMTPRPAHSDD